MARCGTAGVAHGNLCVIADDQTLDAGTFLTLAIVGTISRPR
jgi:hypothetical protein